MLKKYICSENKMAAHRMTCFKTYMFSFKAVKW